jgi:preprotein translocase subunit SecA
MEAKEKEMGTELLLRVFRHFYLEEIDKAWVEHLTNMEHLRDGIGLRGYGQRDPKQEYKKEGYDIFITMMAGTSSNVATKLFKVKVQKENDIERMEREDAERHLAQQRAMQMRHGGEVEGGGEEPEPAARPSRKPEPKIVAQPQQRSGPKIGRNDLCPCGSGQKFKKCHGASLEDDAGSDADA